MKVLLTAFFICALIIGVCLLFNISYIDIADMARKSRRLIQRKKTIKTTIELYSKEKKSNFIMNEIHSAKDILKETRQEKGYVRLILSCIILSAIGVIISVLFLHNYIAAPLLGIAGLMIPLWQQKIYKNRYDKFLDMRMETALSLITTSYVKSGDIIKAVQENVKSFDDTIKFAFDEFLTETSINPNMEDCIRNLQTKFTNNIFYEWCGVLIKTYYNSEIKENLIAVTKKFSTVRIIQSDLDTETGTELSNYVILILADIVVYPMVWLLNKDWFAMYINTTVGHICIAVTIFTVMFAVTQVIGLLKPVKFER